MEDIKQHREGRVKVLVCPKECDNPEQDAIYGKNHRLHNACIRSGNLWAYRCTVCQNEVKV